ncbi:MAG: GNAT family N-acetyltransferase [Sporolactobacillus sp.]
MSGGRIADLQELRFIPFSAAHAHAAVALWNAELSADFPMTAALFHQNSLTDANVLSNGSWSAFTADGGLAGYVISKYFVAVFPRFRPRSGWIQVLLVRRSVRGHGIGGELLRRAETALWQHGVSQITLGQDVNHYFPGIPDDYPQVQRWFEAHGYSGGTHQHDLLTERAEQLPQLPDVHWILLDHQDRREQLLAFLCRAFPGRWHFEAVDYFRHAGTGREFLVMEKQGKVIGFCRLNDAYSPLIGPNVYWARLFSDPVGGIGPLGIDPAVRGNGYGLALVRAAVAVQQMRGNARVIIDWTDITNFYSKVDARRWKSYTSYVKRPTAVTGDLQDAGERQSSIEKEGYHAGETHNGNTQQEHDPSRSDERA